MNQEWENSARECEFNWWVRELKKLGIDEFRKYEQEYFTDLISMFNGKFKANGDVLNIGMGLMSIFEFIKVDGRKVEVDPLVENYINIIKPGVYFETYLDTSKIEDDSIDTVICFNAIDHTSFPEKVISEIERVLKKDGTLFLEVNFDRYKSPAHYQVFSRSLVEKLFQNFKIIFDNFNPDCGSLKNWDEFYAIMVKK